MGISEIYVHTNTALSGAGTSRILREGSVVSVRILAKTGPQSYTVSFAGTRVDVQSSLHLEPGSVFSASVTLQNGKVALIPKSDSMQQSGAAVVQLTSEQISFDGPVPLTNPQLVSYFTSLNIIPDTLSLHIVQQLQQLGARFDTKLLARIRRIAEKFPGQEGKAAETALVLEHKGIESTYETVAAIINEKGGQRKYGSTEDSSGTDETGMGCTEKEVRYAVKEYSSSVFSPYGTDSCKQGLLTVSNHLGSPLHWTILPFELTIKHSKNTQKGYGVLRLFSDIVDKKCRKIILDMELSGQKSFYVLYLNHDNNRCSRVRLCVQPEPVDKADFIKRLCSFLQTDPDEPVAAEWIAEQECTPFFTDNIPLSVIEGCV